MKKLVAVMAVVLVASPAMAGTILTPHVAGSLQGWQAGTNPMVETAAGSDIWTATFTGLVPGGREEFKITDGTWTNTYPSANSWLYADGAGNVTITYDGNTYADGWSTTMDRLILDTDSPTGWTATGSFQSQIGGADWDNGNPATAMAAMGGGIYSLTAVLAPGTYDWKAVVAGSPTWDAISWDNRSVNASNWSFTTDAVNDTVTFQVDAFTGVAQVNVTPEPTTIALLGLGALALIRRRR